MKLFQYLLVIAASSALLSCSKRYAVTGTSASQERINTDSLHLYDSATHYFIAPYKAKLDAQMNSVIGSTLTTLTKERPESTLGKLMTEASVWYASAHYDKPIDLCVMNYGGIRIPSIQAGNITLGKVYELMPFDNQLEVLEISGQTVYALLQLVAANDGWPLYGVTMVIDKGTATGIMIGDQPLELNKTYTLATSDYIANGGDKAEMLSTYTKRTGFNYKLRDAITDYIKYTGELNLAKDGKVTVKP
jgi:2',3'-cyclic-nucleotide 2'-phosphodiesterase (5'-nucleotidase family)